MIKDFYKLISLYFIIFMLSSCAEAPKLIPNCALGTPFAFNPNVSVNVLTYKFLAGNIATPENKVVFLRIFCQNTSPNNSVKFKAESAIRSIEIIPQNSKSSIPLDVTSPIVDPQDTNVFVEDTTLEAQKTITFWVRGNAPKELVPPFIIKVTPVQGREMIIQV